MQKCNVCNSSKLIEIIRINQIPVYNNILVESKEDSINVPRGDIQLCFCQNCGHLFNAAFLPDLINYTDRYENSLYYSPRFRKYANELVGELIAEYDLRGKQIVEIGCGQGDFLKSICLRGGNSGFGFDPSYRGDTQSDLDKNIRVVQDEFPSQYGHHKADFVYARHLLEHLPFPIDFVSELRHIIGENLSTRIFLEVPNSRFTLKDLGIWDLIYEHCSYFSANSLNYLLDNAGFLVDNLKYVYNGQFLQIYAIPRDFCVKKGNSSPIGKWDSVDELQILASNFMHNYHQKVNYWSSTLESIREENQRVVVWGAGSKGVTFLNIFRDYDVIEYAVDINPKKIGKYVSGAGQRIVHPNYLIEYKPDKVIVLNQIYENEIRNQITDMGLSLQFLFA